MTKPFSEINQEEKHKCLDNSHIQLNGVIIEPMNKDDKNNIVQEHVSNQILDIHG